MLAVTTLAVGAMVAVQFRSSPYLRCVVEGLSADAKSALSVSSPSTKYLRRGTSNPINMSFLSSNASDWHISPSLQKCSNSLHRSSGVPVFDSLEECCKQKNLTGIEDICTNATNEAVISDKHGNYAINNTTSRKVFVDLGANYGNTYLQRKEQLDSDRWEVYLWEPSPQMHEFFLDKLAEVNRGNANFHILPYAAGVRDGEIELFVHRGQEHVKNKTKFRDGGRCDPKSPYNLSGGTTIFKEAKVAGDSVSVGMRNFPKWLDGLNLKRGEDNEFIFKIDIEGAELDILEKMLAPNSNDNICLADKIEMEFHKQIFAK